MTNNKLFILLCIFFLNLNSCTSVKNALSGKKVDTSDEFLIEKKNPLIMPPDYQDLPEPIDEELVEENSDADIEKLIGVYNDEISEETTESSSSIEKFDLENINKD